MGEMVGLEEGPRDWVVGGRRWWWVVVVVVVGGGGGWWWVVVVGGGGCWWVVVGGGGWWWVVKFSIFSDGPHTRLAAARLFFATAERLVKLLSGP